jgi:catechol 2,3-dioxygenase-like lactoylglutathione lyase family enzyme
MSDAGAPAPRLEGLLEASLYHDADQARVIERFYGELLGLALVSRWPGGMAFRAGTGVLLLFDRATLAERDGPISAHGSSGPGHACVLAPGARYEEWKQRLAEVGVDIAHEHRWGEERRSLYFSDPAGNLLEIADGDIWPAEFRR